ncbi:MAG: hypothetical protein WBI18_06955 [Candidatus Saccharicenans sp.]
MSENERPVEKPLSIIQEIENRLEEYLRRQREEIEKALEERIQKERELARQQLAEIEQAVRKEWLALEEYGQVWEQFEEKRQGILKKIQETLEKIVVRQKEIERLALETVEDINLLSVWHGELEELRRQSIEKAASLKKGLEEKFGLREGTRLITPEESINFDLTPELEKLKKVKELLLLEKGVGEPAVTAEAGEVEEPAVEEKMEAEPQAASYGTPETEETEGLEERMEADKVSMTEVEEKEEESSLEEKLAEQIRKTFAQKQHELESGEKRIVSRNEVKSAEEPEIARQDLERYYREEHVNGSNPIGYYEGKGKNILEANEILLRLKESVDEARKLQYKLAFITDAKEQFYLKQELVSLQESLRKFLLQIIYLISRKQFRFPALTQDILNQQSLLELADLLAVQNWGSADDLSQFEQRIIILMASFKARTTPENIYYGALLKELEA